MNLRIWAESYADAQQTRIALVNRMERGGVDADLLSGHRDLLEASENAFRLADHLARIEYLRLHIAGVERTIAEHEDAIELIQRLGGSCLGDVEGAA